MQSLTFAIAVVTSLFIGISAQADTYTYETVDAPFATLGTEARGITTTGTIAGSYLNAEGSGRHGFILTNGNVTAFDHPNASRSGTYVMAINDKRQVIGNFWSTGASEAFLYSQGTFTPIAAPNAAWGTYVTGINNLGFVVGEYVDADGVRRSFVKKGDGYFTLAHPKAMLGMTRASGINNTGWEAGLYSDGSGTHGFLDVGGVYTTIDHPDADPSGTTITALNSSAAATGYYHSGSGFHGFVFAGDAFSAVDYPGAVATFPMGINDNGTVTGIYYDGRSNRGFVATPRRQATRVYDFTSNLGINTHLNHAGQVSVPLDTAVAALKYLKLQNVRDSPTEGSLESWTEVVVRTGAKFDAYIPTGNPGAMQEALDRMPGLAHAGLLNLIEGPNEEDNPYPVSQGNSIETAAQFQKSVYQTGRSLGLPVISLSFGGGWSFDNNWASNYDKVGDLSAICDYANAHTFPFPGGGQPDVTLQMTIRNAKMAATQRPVIHTELGYDYRTPDDKVAPAMLQGIFDAFQDGAAKTYIYALFDEAGGHTFGVMNADGSPKPEGIALSNLMTILEDRDGRAASFTPGVLPYNITSTTGADRTYLMQKADGTYWLVVWNETQVRHPVTVTFAQAPAGIQTFNPVASMVPQQKLNNVPSVTLDMTGAPQLIEVWPFGWPAH